MIGDHFGVAAMPDPAARNPLLAHGFLNLPRDHVKLQNLHRIRVNTATGAPERWINNTLNIYSMNPRLDSIYQTVEKIQRTNQPYTLFNAVVAIVAKIAQQNVSIVSE